MKVRPNENARQSPYLSAAKEYYVIGLDHESFRVVDDNGEPVLFPREYFDVLDDSIPSDWIWDWFGDDEFYADPPELHTPGFYEDFFDGKEEAIMKFNDYMSKIKN